MSLVEKVVKYALKLGADEAHAVYARSKETSIEMESDQISRTSYGVSESIYVTVIVRKRIASARINAVTEQAALACTEKAYRMALALKPNENWSGLPEPKPLKDVPELYDKKIAELTAEEIAERAKNMLETAREVSDKVHVMGGNISTMISKHTMATSRGFYDEEERTTFIASLVTVAKDAGKVGSFASESDASRKLDVNVEEIAEKAAQKALDSLNLKPVESFKGTLLLDYEFAAWLIRSLAGAYNGYYVWKKNSPLADKIGEQVASEILTVIDDGALPAGLASSRFDGEGSPTARTVVIERGVLKTFINNTFTANVLSMKPTGNAWNLLFVGPWNTLVEPGDRFEEELISEVKRGLLVSRFSGMIRFQDGLVSGTAKQAFYVENGEKKFPVRECMIAGNLYDFIKNISAIGKTAKRTPFAVITPHIRIENVNFVSKQ